MKKILTQANHQVICIC